MGRVSRTIFSGAISILIILTTGGPATSITENNKGGPLAQNALILDVLARIEGRLNDVAEQVANIDQRVTDLAGQVNAIDGRSKAIEQGVIGIDTTVDLIGVQTTLFGAETQICFEVSGNYSLGLGGNLGLAVEAEGGVGFKPVGTGIKGLIKLDLNGGIQSVFGAEIVAPKTVVCINGPAVEVTGPGWDGILVDLAELVSKLAGDSGASMARDTGINSTNFNNLLATIRDLDFKPEASTVLGSGSQFITDLAKNLPINDKLRDRLINRADLVDGFRNRFLDICFDPPPGFPADLVDAVCALAANSTAFVNAIDTTRTLVSNVQANVNTINARVQATRNEIQSFRNFLIGCLTFPLGC